MGILDHVADEHLNVSGFVGLVFLISAPFWVLGALSASEILPALPVSSLMVVAPVAAAVILVRRKHGARKASALVLRVFDTHLIRPAFWYAPIILLMPGALLAAFGIMLLAGVDMPGIVSSPVQVLIFLALFWLAGAAEEVGWTGYATGPLIQRYGVFRAGVVLGLIWTIWHLIPFFQTGRGALWILMHCFVTVELRVVMVWLFTRTHGSVAAATIFHAMSNVSFFLFPALGSHYDPAYLAPVLALIIAAAFCWPSKHREGSD